MGLYLALGLYEAAELLLASIVRLLRVAGALWLP